RGVSSQAPQRYAARELLQRTEQIVQAGAPTSYSALLADSADRERARSFAEFELAPGLTRAVIQERDRAPLAGALPGNGYQLIVDVFTEAGNRARVATWRLDLKRTRDDPTWRIADQEQITSVEGLYRLSLNPAKQYDAHNLKLLGEDMELTLPTGAVFVADTDQGTTALVLLGRGQMRFDPRPQTEKGQVKIFCGKETLESAFDAAFVRINPADFDTRVAFDRLTARAVDA